MKDTPAKWLILGLLAGCLISACQPSAPPSTALPPAPTPTAVALPAVSPATRHAAPAAATAIPTRESTPALNSCEAPVEWGETAIRYEISAELDFATKTVAATLDVYFRNDTETELHHLIFYVAPNKQPGMFTLEGISLDGSADQPATLEGVRLTVPLDIPLPPGCGRRLNVRYAINLPRMGTGYFPRQGYLGYSDRQLNLGHWIPTLAYFSNGEWVTPTPINVGEQTVTPAADYHVALTISHAPDDLYVVGPGTVARRGATWRFDLPAARDCTLSFSDQFHRLAVESPDGIQVELYTLDDAQPPENTAYDAPAHALDTAVTALGLYADLYGPYPYERLAIVESDFPDGMEFSGLVFVGGEWFRSFQGDPASYLTLITAHEVSHQWWYGLVANDQSAAPWLDEALATYSEYVFLEENYPQLMDWWWEFRVNAYSPAGAVDATVYEFDSVRAYINAVYLRGARLMHALRQDIGGEVFFQWLHDYVEAMRGQIATPDDLWAALPPEVLETTQNTRAAYLRDPHVARQRRTSNSSLP